MQRLAGVLTAALVATALMSGTAWADNEWSSNDPVFNIRGTVFRLTTSVQDRATVTGITYDVTLPADAAGVTTVAYPKGARIPTTVIVRYDGTSSPGGYLVSASVTVSGSAGKAVRVDVTGPSVTARTETGETNTAILMTFTAAR